MPRHRPVLSDDKRIRLAMACARNVGDLLREADALMTEGALPYALFLVGSAFEELMKCRYCLDQAAPDWPTWWRGFRNHETKVELARQYWPDLRPDATSHLLELRERCLYVEVKQDGDPLTPRGLVDPGDLRADFVRGWSLWIHGEGRATLERLVPPIRFTLPAIGEGDVKAKAPPSKESQSRVRRRPADGRG